MANSLSIIQGMLTRYGMSTYVTLGNLGNILILILFYENGQNGNSCSLYIVTMTICNLICLNVGIIPVIFSLDHLDINNEYILACRIQFYIRHSFFQLMRTSKVLSCLDRYAICSSNIRIRSLSQRKIVRRLIGIFTLFWLSISIFFSLIRTIENHSCNIFNRVYSMIYTIYYLIFAGILPPVFILILTILTMKNLKQLRSRVQPIRRNPIGEMNRSERIVLRKRDQHILRMIFTEVSFYVISTSPFSIYLIYKTITDSTEKNDERRQIESFINYLTQSFLMYLNTASPFYVYILTSPSFRKQFQQFLIRLYAFITRTQTNENAQRATLRN